MRIGGGGRRAGVPKRREAAGAGVGEKEGVAGRGPRRDCWPGVMMGYDAEVTSRGMMAMVEAGRSES